MTDAQAEALTIGLIGRVMVWTPCLVLRTGGKCRTTGAGTHT